MAGALTLYGRPHLTTPATRPAVFRQPMGAALAPDGALPIEALRPR
jgi:hypothetical protein